MKCAKPKLLIVGSLPPPFIGPSVAIEKIISSLNIRKSFDIVFLDISDRRNPTNIGKLDLMNCYLAATHIIKFLLLLLFKKPCLVYLNISQGLWGLIRDLGLLTPAIIFRKKVIIHLRGSEFDKFFYRLPFFIRILTKWGLKKISGAIILGKTLRYVFRDFVDPEKIYIVPNGIDYNKFDPIKRSPLLNESSKYSILYLSGLMKRKGIFQFIQAMSMVLMRYPESRITIAGEWQSSLDRKNALKLIKNKNLNGKIHFVGEVSGTEKIWLFKKNDIFVFPPIQPEGMPWVILEAMSASLPVISTDQGTISEVIKDGKTGYIVEPTPEKIAKKICYLIENPEIAKRMGKLGRIRVEQHFSEQIYFEKLETIFKQAIYNV